MFLKQPPCPLWTHRLNWLHVPTIVQVDLWTECENWAEGYTATRRGEEEETEGTTSFFYLPPDLLGLKLLYGSSHLPGHSYINPDWQLRWTVHIRRLSTMPLVQQWTVNVHGWQGDFIDTEKWERKEYKENTHFCWHFLDTEVWEKERAHTYIDTFSIPDKCVICLSREVRGLGMHKQYVPDLFSSANLRMRLTKSILVASTSVSMYSGWHVPLYWLNVELWLGASGVLMWCHNIWTLCNVLVTSKCKYLLDFKLLQCSTSVQFLLT